MQPRMQPPASRPKDIETRVHVLHTIHSAHAPPPPVAAAHPQGMASHMPQPHTGRRSERQLSAKRQERGGRVVALAG